jgi:transposase
MKPGKHPRFSDEFKRDAVHQVVERGYTIAEVATRLGIGKSTLAKWKSKYANPNASYPENSGKGDIQLENARLKAELKRITEERDILKKAAAYFAKNAT